MFGHVAGAKLAVAILIIPLLKISGMVLGFNSTGKKWHRVIPRPFVIQNAPLR
jgi:hypothetical protein